MPFAATLMDLEDILLSEVSQIEKEKYCITYMWNLKVQVNLYRTGTNLTNVENKFMVTKGEKEVGMDKLGMWD